MALWLDRKYLNIVSQKLDRFVWKSENLANLRCPFCGDSQKNKYKARGYVFEKKGILIYHCHNCNVGMSLQNFLKQIDPQVRRQYLLERYNQPSEASTEASSPPVVQNPVVVKSIDLPRITDLSQHHPAFLYLSTRKIPFERFIDIYYAEDFKKFCDKLIPEHGKVLRENDSRVIIPTLSDRNELTAVSGRSLDPKNEHRYIVMSVTDGPKIYGLDKFDKTQSSYITEGPFDAMFLPNSLASGNSNLAEVIPYINKKKTVFVLDNEPHNPDIIRSMKKVVSHGCKIFLWPETIDAKDINELILQGYTTSEILGLLDSKSVEGLSATFQITQWSKI